MSRARFEIILAHDKHVFIADTSPGTDTIRDHAASVVEYVNSLYPGHRIIYRDGEGRWGELLHEDGVFKGIAQNGNSVPQFEDL